MDAIQSVVQHLVEFNSSNGIVKSMENIEEMFFNTLRVSQLLVVSPYQLNP